MRRGIVMAAVAVLMAVPGGRSIAAQLPSDSLVAHVRVDSSRHEVLVSAGPWRRAPMSDDMMAMPGMHHVAAAATFNWPVGGWVRGLRFRARTRDGHDVPRSALHHLALVNLGRRDLFYQIPERMFEMGGETGDIVLPGSVAIPVAAGTPMVLTIAWGNSGRDPLPDVTVELALDWLPENSMPAPLSAFPVTMQVTTAAGTSFDLPPGANAWASLFPMTVAGQVVAAGGHLHDFGTGILLRDLSMPGSGPVLSLASRQNGAGHVTEIQRTLPGLNGPRIELRAGDLYQLEGRYANTTGITISDGGMAFLVMLYAPDRPGDWPVADSQAVMWRQFLEHIGVAGNGT